MSRVVLGLLIALAALSAAQAQSTATRVGDGLRKGMRLIYRSEGSGQAPWVVDSLDLNAQWQSGALGVRGDVA